MLPISYRLIILDTALRVQKSLNDWFDATEHYPQLHELDRDDYLATKRHEVQRQATEAPPARGR